MKKLSKFVIAILFSLLCIPSVNAINLATPEVPIPANSIEVNYIGTSSFTTTVTSSDLKKATFHYMSDGELKKDNYREFVYYRGKLGKNGIDISGNLATIKLIRAAYYKKDNSNVYLDVNIQLTRLKLEPVSDKCNTKYSYAFFSYNGKSKIYTSSRIMDENKEETHGWKQCAANVVAEYSITFTASNGVVPTNMVFLWKNTDLDQPDKTNGGTGKYAKNNDSCTPSHASGCKKYVESLVFISGFDTSSFRLTNPTWLARSGSKFIATQKSDKTDEGNKKTSVWALQKGTTAKIKWIASYGVETSIIGDQIKEESPCVGPSCNPPPPEEKPKECVHDINTNTYYDSTGSMVSYFTFLNDCKDFYYKGNTCDSKEDISVDCGVKKEVVDAVKGSVKNKFNIWSVKDKSKEVVSEDDLHSSCKGDITVEKDYYLKEIANGTVKYWQNGVLVDANSDKCVPVKVSIPIVSTENITLNVNAVSKLSDSFSEPMIYAGGGFDWSGAELINDVSFLWRYSRAAKDSSSDYSNVVKLNFQHTYNGFNVPDSYYSLADFTLYSDSNCNNSVSYSDLNKEIKKVIEIRNVTFNNEFVASSDSNIVDGEKKMSLNGTSRVLENTVNDDTQHVMKVYSDVRLKNAYIDRWTSDVIYADSKEDETYLDAGNLYYVPLKYSDDYFKIKMESSNLSVIDQEKTFSTVCSVRVEHIYYKKTELNKGEIAYKYRSIKVNDMFNGKSKDDIAKNAKNWARWYCDENGNCGKTSNSPNKNRIENTFKNAGCNNIDAATTNKSEHGICSNPLYFVKLDTAKIHKIQAYSGSPYWEFNRRSENNDDGKSFLEENGNSSFVQDASLGFINPTIDSYCKLGEFSTSCDKWGDS